MKHLLGCGSANLGGHELLEESQRLCRRIALTLRITSAAERDTRLAESVTAGSLVQDLVRAVPGYRHPPEVIPATVQQKVATTTANVDLIRPSEVLDLWLSVNDVRSLVCPPRAPHLSQIMKRQLAGDDAVDPGG
jgi:hypothetical protein